MKYLKLSPPSKRTMFCGLLMSLLLLESIDFGESQGARLGLSSASKFGQRQSTQRQSIVKINSGRRTQVKPVNSAAVKALTSKSWNLGFCGFRLKFNGKQLNRNNLRFTTSDAASVASLIGNEQLADKLYVWCRTAHLSKVAERKRGNSKGTEVEFDVEKLRLFHGDIVLTLSTVDAVLKPYENSFLRENGRSIPRGALSSIRSFQRVLPTSRLPTPIRGSNNLGAQRGGTRRTKRKIIPESFFLWENEQIDYILASSLLPRSQTAVLTAIAEWEQWTCLRFNKIPDSPIFTPHIVFDSLDGCWSNVGKQANGQTVSIGPGCEWTGIAAHEIGHALGFFHEQSRPDRDTYVTVNLQNVLLGLAANFEKLGWPTIKTSGQRYEYESVMHYAPLDFSSNSLHTIDPKDPYMISVIGQRESLTFGDIKLANVNYCSKICGDQDLEWDECQNGGYRNPNQCLECICPKGFSPPKCETLDAGENALCGDQELTSLATYQTITSDGYVGNGYQANSYCIWRITAPANHMVEFDFLDDFGFDFGYLNITCDLSYVEIRKEPQMAGKRFCNKDRPSEIVHSAGSEMTVILVGGPNPGGKGFKGRYRSVACGGCAAGGGSNQPVCSKFVHSKVKERVIQSCNGPSCETRDNANFQLEEFCCDTFQKQGKSCVSTTATTTTPAPTTTTTPAPTTTTTPAPTTTITPAPTITTTPVQTTTITPAPITTTTQVPKTTTTPVPKTTTTPVPKTTTTPAPTTTTTPVPTKATTTIDPEIPDADGFSKWTAFSPCTRACGYCGAKERERRCLRPPCIGRTLEFSRCPFEACPFRPVRVRGCYFAGDEVWCLPADTNCFMLGKLSSVLRSAGGGAPLTEQGVPILGIVDLKTGDIQITDTTTKSPGNGRGNNGVGNGRGNVQPVGRGRGNFGVPGK